MTDADAAQAERRAGLSRDGGTLAQARKLEVLFVLGSAGAPRVSRAGGNQGSLGLDAAEAGISAPTTLLVLSRDDLMRHMQAHPRTAVNLLGEMARRLRRADETIAQLALCDVNERLIHRLVGLAREEGASGPDGLVVRRRPTQQELANMIGSCRETISRAFNQLARDGLIIPRGRSLVVTPALIERCEKKKAA